ncbi:MAG: DNA-binding domain-containing protein [Rhodospirillales bacterium]
MTIPLTDLQDLFQDRLLTGRADIEAHLTSGGPFLKVYDHAYEARLLEVMGDDFPAVHTLLGDDAFAEAAAAYVRGHPSRRRSVRWLGAGFAAWLGVTAPWSDLPVVADMAAFEWGLGLAFDAPDAITLDVAALAAVPPEAWPVLGFDFHPAFNTFELSHEVATFQQAVAREEDPEAAPAPLADGAQTWAAWRDGATCQVRYRALAGDEAAGLAVLRDGGDFQALCERLADFGDADAAAPRAAGYLRGWVEGGWITGLSAPGFSWA